MPKRLVYISGCIPTLTCTFIQREIFDLREIGFDIETISMNVPEASQISRDAEKLIDNMLFLDQIPELHKCLAFMKCMGIIPRRLFRCLSLFFRASPMQGSRDYLRLGYHLIESCYLASVFRASKPDHIHCHFIHGPTSLGMFLSELIGVPFSFTMHASLIWTDPLAFHTKLKQCKFCVSISEFNKQHVLRTYGHQFESKIKVVHCGVRLPERPLRPSSTSDPRKILLLAVGQLKRRKGFHVLVEAVNLVTQANVQVQLTIVGEGEQRPLLEERISMYGLQDNVKLAGAQLHETIPTFLACADIFILPCVVGEDNTRDGIPVALMEAMAYGLPVISTSIVGLPELVESGSDGILVEPDNPKALAEAIMILADSAELRKRLGASAIKKIDKDFNALRSAKQLAALFHT